MALASQIAGEEYYRIAIGQGMYTSELPSNIPDGYSSICYNMVATGDSVENRIGFHRGYANFRVIEDAPNWSDTIYTSDPDNRNFFCQMDPWTKQANKIAFGWGSKGYNFGSETDLPHRIHLVRSQVGGAEGYVTAAIANEFLGMCDYNGVGYFSMRENGIKRFTTIDWVANTITYSDIASSSTSSLKGIFIFKDRMWGWNANKLYYTDLPATPGAPPETWAFAANMIIFSGPNGNCQIKKIVSLGNKLAVFTTNGFFTLLVEGAPASWILRVIDSRSIATTSQCAFESKGIIYYVNTQGVWATNNLTTTKLSAVIEDQWFLASGRRIHTICPYEDGMIVSIGKIMSPNWYFDKTQCRIFYSKLDPIGWSEWNINRNGMTGTPSTYNIACIWSTTDKIPSIFSYEPLVYFMAFVTNSTTSVPTSPVLQMLYFDGGTDQYWDRSGAPQGLSLGIYLKTKRFDGGNPYNIKRAKRGMLEIFTSDANHNFRTSWDIDATSTEGSEVQSRTTTDNTAGVGSNLVQVLNQFYYRRAALNIRAELQTETSQIKIKDVAIAQDTGMAEYEETR